VENDQPNSFKANALSHIPNHIIESMQRQTGVKTAGLTGLEAIAVNGGTPLLPPPTPMAQAPTKKLTVSLAVDGHVIEVPINPTDGAVMMLLYLLATVWSKDKKVAKVLKQFKFEFFDANGTKIYPKKNVKK